MNVEFLTKKDIKKIKLTNTLNFWVIKKFNFQFNCFNRYIKKGKEHQLYYNPKSKLNSFKDGYLIVNINNFIFKVSLKEY